MLQSHRIAKGLGHRGFVFAKADYNKAKDALQHEHQHRLNDLEEALQSKDMPSEGKRCRTPRL